MAERLGARRRLPARRLAARRRRRGDRGASSRADTAHAIKAVLRRAQRDLDRRDHAHPADPRGDRPRRPSGAADGRHDLVARLDRLPARRVGRRRHRRRLAEGPDAAARACRSTRSATRRSPRSKQAQLPRSYWDWDEMLAIERGRATSRTRRRPICSTACTRRSTMLFEEGLPQRVRAPRPPRRGDAPRGARRGASRSCAPIRPSTARSLTAIVMPDGHDADAFRRDGARALRPVARHGPRQARRQGVPHRPPRLLQRPDAVRHARAASRWGSRLAGVPHRKGGVDAALALSRRRRARTRCRAQRSACRAARRRARRSTQRPTGGAP